VDRNAALAAAARLAAAGRSYQFDSRDAFYRDIADELGVTKRRASKRTGDGDNDDDGRTEMPSSGGRGSSGGSAKRSDEPGDFLKELDEGRTGGFF